MVREYQRLQTVDQQIRALEQERKTLLATARTTPVAQAKLLAELCGIGPMSRWVFAMEFFGWRQLPTAGRWRAPRVKTKAPVDQRLEFEGSAPVATSRLPKKATKVAKAQPRARKRQKKTG